MRLWPLQNARVYLKTPNAPGQRAFLRCAASFFLEIRQYSCEKMSCATQKSLAAGHIMSFQIHPSFSITSSSISCSNRRISFCKNSGRRGPVSSMPTVFAAACPFSARLHIAPAAFLYVPRRLYSELPRGCGESCNSLSRSDSSRVWTFYQISLQDFIPYGILDRKKTGKSNF